MAGLCCRQVVPSGPAQVQTCHVGSRPVPGGGAVGYCVPFGWPGLFRCLGAQRPGGPAYPAGVPISPEKWGERGPGASPLDPDFYSRSFPLAGFCRVQQAIFVTSERRRSSAPADKRPRRWQRPRSGSPLRGSWGCGPCSRRRRWYRRTDRPLRSPAPPPASPPP